MQRGNVTVSARLALDLVMTVLLVFCLGARLAGPAAHEWVGLVFILLVTLHVWINRQWVASIFGGRYSARRIVSLFVNVSLAVLVMLMACGGLANSRTVLGFLELKGSLGFREIHVFASYWLLVITGIHVGLHWSLIAGWLEKAVRGSCHGRRAAAEGQGLEKKTAVPHGRDRKNAHSLHQNPYGKVLRRVFWILVSAVGIWASFDRDMGSKLFRGFGFDYWDPERPVALFYASMVCIMMLYALAVRVFFRGWEHFRRARVALRMPPEP